MKPSDFAAVIAGLEAFGLSKRTIATRAGLSRGYVHRIAAGEVQRPSYDTVTRLTTLQRSVEMSSAAAPKIGITRPEGSALKRGRDPSESRGRISTPSKVAK